MRFSYTAAISACEKGKQWEDKNKNRNKKHNKKQDKQIAEAACSSTHFPS